MNREERGAQFREYDTQEMRQLCLNCSRKNCTGSCEKIEKLNRQRARCARKDTRLYTYEGETHPLSFWAQMINVTPNALQQRLNKNGGNMQAALEMKYHNRARTAKKYTAFGLTRTMAEWAVLCEKDESTLRDRLRRGKSPEEAFREAGRRL